MKAGKVTLVGAGPGDIGLMTLKAQSAIKNADVIVYDALIGTEALMEMPNGIEKIFVGKRAENHAMPQEEINRLLLEKALEGKNVVRLKGGDPFLFGRGGEELALLKENSVPFEAIPGIPSPIAAAAYSGIPITHRGLASSLAFVTARSGGSGSPVDFEALARLGGTIVFMMGAGQTASLAEGLIAAGMDKRTPCATVSSATTARQEAFVSDIGRVAEEGFSPSPPAVFIVGEVCRLQESYKWREALPLAGLRVAVARGGEKAEETAQALRALGSEAVAFRAIEQVDIEGGSEAFSRLGSYNWIAIASPYGCEAFFRRLNRLELDIRSVGASFAVVGEATAKALKAHSVMPALIAVPPTGKALGTALAKAMEPKSEALVCRSAIGGESLAEELRKAGRSFTDVALYTSELASESEEAKRALTAGIDIYLFMSASSVRGLAQMAGKTSFSGEKAVCIGESTAAEARGLGFEAIVAAEASEAGMAETLIKLNKERTSNGSHT